MGTSARTLLIVSQVYVPDPASVGQHMHDAAQEMVRRGWNVMVLAADRGYEDPSARYERYELRDGVEIRRLPWSSFGKASIATRVAAGSSFVGQAILAALALPRVDHLLVSTSPPMAGLAGVVLSRVRDIAMTFWAMDLNPDQIVAAGALAPSAWPVRMFEVLNRSVLGTARSVVALDSYMAERIGQKWPVHDKLSVLPPWPHVRVEEPLPHAENPFRAEHGLEGKLVVMYSGNLSPAHPVTTILEAALRLRDEPRLVLLFIGGGLGRAEIERYVTLHRLENVRVLPYQPLAALRLSLSGADVHLVTMGDRMVGIVHPCKIYGALAVSRPVFVLGPRRCHLSDLVLTHDLGWQVEQGDVQSAVRVLRGLLDLPSAHLAATLAAKGERARALIASDLSRERLCGRFCDLLEQGLALAPA